MKKTDDSPSINRSQLSECYNSGRPTQSENIFPCNVTFGYHLFPKIARPRLKGERKSKKLRYNYMNIAQPPV